MRAHDSATRARAALIIHGEYRRAGRVGRRCARRAARGAHCARRARVGLRLGWAGRPGGAPWRRTGRDGAGRERAGDGAGVARSLCRAEPASGRSISVCWLLASGLKNQMQTQWHQQDRSIPKDSPPRGHPFQKNNHERLVTPRQSMRVMRPIPERNSSIYSLSDGLIMNYVACLPAQALMRVRL